jgi:hypothetical protein
MIKRHPLTNVINNQVMRTEYMRMAEDAKHSRLARVYTSATVIMCGIGIVTLSVLFVAAVIAMAAL